MARRKTSKTSTGKDSESSDDELLGPGTAPELRWDDGSSTVVGTGGLEHLMPRWVATEAMSTETAYEELEESFTNLLLSLQRGDAFSMQKRKMITETQSRKAGAPGSAWGLDDTGLLRYRGSVYVPQDRGLRKEIIKTNHDDPTGGHFGTARTVELILRKYYWPSAAKDIREYVCTCDVCQRTRMPQHCPYGLLQPLPTSTRPWKDLFIDLIINLLLGQNQIGSATSSYDAILVIVDRYMKMSKYFLIRKTLDA
jgi:hypothetical protein